MVWMSDDGVWDREADVVVVGSGAAGLSAALTAVSEGASVVVLERAAVRGGTTAKSGGGFWIPNNSLMRAVGIEDPKEDAIRLMCRTAFPYLYDPSDATFGLPRDAYELIVAFYDNASVAVDHLTELGALQPELGDTPGYHADLAEDLVPVGRGLRNLGTPARKSDGTGGDLMTARMEARLVELGGVVLLDHRVMGVLRNDLGEVVGVEVHVGRRTELVRAHRAVVFASGGFLHDPDLRREYLRGPVFGGCAADTNTGDFVRIGIALGAQLGNMNNAWWNQVVLEVALRTPSTIRDVWLPFGDSMIQVNRYGRRAVNEKMPYNERAQVHHEWNAAAREYSNLLMFMIYDDSVAQDPMEFGFRIPIPLPDESADYVIVGDTWEELAARIDERLAGLSSRTGGVRLDAGFAENLRATITRWNEMADEGVDHDFHRGESPIQVEWSQTTRGGGKNPTMHAFRDEGPYYCVILGGGSLDTKGGPRINTSAQVLAVDGSPIPGLYGAGNCIASPAGQAYWSAGGTIGPAMTFGYIAGMNAAKEPDKISSF
jgi:succinate dehydrogenase/fumarate reductase flavoprotein subunit